MKILTMLVMLVLLPACVHPQKEIKQYRGLSEPAQKYIASRLMLCDTYARKNAILAANEGYSEAEILQVFKLAQDHYALKEKLTI